MNGWEWALVVAGAYLVLVAFAAMVAAPVLRRVSRGPRSCGRLTRRERRAWAGVVCAYLEAVPYERDRGDAA